MQSKLAKLLAALTVAGAFAGAADVHAQAPTALSAGAITGTDAGGAAVTSVGIRFSEPLEAASAEAIGNYTISGATVTSATLLPNTTDVRLVVTGLASGNFNVNVTGVKDAGGAAMTAAAVAGTFSNLTAEDVGAPTLEGSTTYVGTGDYDVVAGGVDIWGGSDQFQFAHATKTGDFDIQAKVTSLTTGVNDHAKIGLMAREKADGVATLDGADRNLHVFVKPSTPLNQYEAGGRGLAGDPEVGPNTDSAGWGVNWNNGNAPATYPNNWVRLRRIGPIFDSWISTNGVNWQKNGQSSPLFPFSNTLEVGIASTSHNDGVLVFGTVEDFTEVDNSGVTVTVATQPANTSAPANGTATISAALNVTGISPDMVSYQWQSKAPGATDFANIAGARTNTYTTPILTAEMTGTQYRLLAGVPTKLVTSSVATLTVANDTTGPTVTGAVADATQRQIHLTFSEAVDPTTGAVAGNYTVNGLAVSAASVNGNTVTLTTAQQTEGANYTVTVAGVKDTAGNNVLATGNTFSFRGWVKAGGFIYHRLWQAPGDTNPGLGTIRDPNAMVLDNITFDFDSFEPLFEWPPNGATEGGGGYVNELTGWLVAPETGSYVFFLSADDGAELYLSTDADPANVKLIAREPLWTNPRDWTGTTRTEGDYRGDPAAPDNRSDTNPTTEWPEGNTINLVAGQRYYMRVIHGEGGGGDNVGVNWQLPSQDAPPANGTPAIAASHFEVLADPALFSLSITQQPTALVLSERTSGSFTVAYEGSHVPSIQWQQSTSGGAFTNIAGATSATFNVNDVTTAQSGTRYRAILVLPGINLTTEEVSLTVNNDTAGPKLVSAKGDVTQSKIHLTFDEPVDATTGAVAANYAVPGLTVTGVTVSGNVVTLTTSAHTEGQSYPVTVTGVNDRFGNVIAGSNTANFSGFVKTTGLVYHRLWQGTGTTNPGLDTIRDPNALAVENLTLRIDGYEPRAEFPRDGATEGGNGYVNEMSGWLIAPETGNYVFFVSGDDNAELYLSTDSDPANVKLIAREPSWTGARDWTGTTRNQDGNPEFPYRVSAEAPVNRSDLNPETEWPTGSTITLTQGQRYYLRVIHGEGGGGDNIGVNWQLPSQSTPPANGTPAIAGTHFEVLIDPRDLVTEGATITATAGASGTITLSWDQAGTLESTTAFNVDGTATWAPVAGATGTSHTVQTTDRMRFFRVRQ